VGAQLFVPITKVDIERREVWGVAAEEATDKTGREKFDFAESAPFFSEWSEDFRKRTTAAGQEPSLGNVRYMHQPDAVGKLVALELDQATKQVRAGARVVDEAAWEKVRAGVLTGFSIGGDYVRRWDDPEEKGVKRYAARPSEISLVDNPCMYGATFELVRADGATELVKFHGEAAAGGDGVSSAEVVAPAARLTAAGDVLRAASVQKAWCEVARLAEVVDQAARLARHLSEERDWQGSDTGVPDAVQAAALALADALCALSAECADELRGEAPASPAVVAEVEVEADDAEDDAEPLMAAADAALRKISPVDARRIMRRVQKLHDYAVEIGAACAPASAEKTTETTMPAAPAQEEDDMDLETLQKALAANNEAQAKASHEALTKVVGDAVAPLQTAIDTLAKGLAEQGERVAALEAQPAVAKGVTKAVAGVMPERGAPGADEDDDAVLAKLAPADRQLALIKRRHRAGGRPLDVTEIPRAVAGL
jgi:hypothetical protein